MSLPKSPAFPLREVIDTGASLGDLEYGAPIPNRFPRVDDTRRFTLPLRRLHKHQADEIRALAKAMHGPAGWFRFNRAVLDGGAGNWVWARFASPTVRRIWVAPDQYDVDLELEERVNPLAS